MDPAGVGRSTLVSVIMLWPHDFCIHWMLLSTCHDVLQYHMQELTYTLLVWARSFFNFWHLLLNTILWTFNLHILCIRGPTVGNMYSYTSSFRMIYARLLHLGLSTNSISYITDPCRWWEDVVLLLMMWDLLAAKQSNTPSKCLHHFDFIVSHILYWTLELSLV